MSAQRSLALSHDATGTSRPRMYVSTHEQEYPSWLVVQGASYGTPWPVLGSSTADRPPLDTRAGAWPAVPISTERLRAPVRKVCRFELYIVGSLFPRPVVPARSTIPTQATCLPGIVAPVAILQEQARLR